MTFSCFSGGDGFCATNQPAIRHLPIGFREFCRPFDGVWRRGSGFGPDWRARMRLCARPDITYCLLVTFVGAAEPSTRITAVRR